MKIRINRWPRIGIFTCAALFVAACSSNEFSAQNGRGVSKSKPLTPSVAGETPSTPGGDDVITADGGGLVGTPDYTQCSKLPNLGYAGVGACETNEVMVMINDGNAGGRSCCPIGASVLSTNAGEVHQARSGSCSANEVSTGIRDMRTPLCTKINTDFLKLSLKISQINILHQRWTNNTINIKYTII